MGHSMLETETGTNRGTMNAQHRVYAQPPVPGFLKHVRDYSLTGI
jgi:hypothetical protein